MPVSQRNDAPSEAPKEVAIADFHTFLSFLRSLLVTDRISDNAYTSRSGLRVGIISRVFGGYREECHLLHSPKY